MVEFWSVFVGLHLAYDRGFGRVDPNLDSDASSVPLVLLLVALKVVVLFAVLDN